MNTTIETQTGVVIYSGLIPSTPNTTGNTGVFIQIDSDTTPIEILT